VGVCEGQPRGAARGACSRCSLRWRRCVLEVGVVCGGVCSRWVCTAPGWVCSRWRGRAGVPAVLSSPWWLVRLPRWAAVVLALDGVAPPLDGVHPRAQRDRRRRPRAAGVREAQGDVRLTRG